jgi:formylglycine-generating enzyme required for sulfatase activity
VVKRVEALIGQANTVVFVLSPDAVQPGTVALKEVEFAALLNKRFAPIVFRPVEDKSVPAELAKLNFIFFDDETQFEQSAVKLGDALQTDIGWIRQHTEYGEAERRWSGAGRPDGLLLHSPTLEVAEYWIGSRPHGAPEPTAKIVAFIAVSRRVARSTQRLRRLVTASIFTLLLGIILGLVGWINQSYIAERWRWWTVTHPYMISQVRPHVLNAGQEQALKPGDSFKECLRDCPEMIIVPPGEFTMGSSNYEIGRYDDEGPQHKVVIAMPFAVSKFDVTFDDWDACVSVGECQQVTDSGNGRGTRPVINVSWDDAQRYMTWFSKMTGHSYRLLTEAEWEYAARAGSTTAYYWGKEIGKGNANCTHCGSNWGSKTSPVGSFKPNAFGLYDMVGNVLQWVQDCYQDHYLEAPTDGSAITTPALRPELKLAEKLLGRMYHLENCNSRDRVSRGGFWGAATQNLRSAHRFHNTADLRTDYLGFRVARTLIP